MKVLEISFYAVKIKMYILSISNVFRRLISAADERRWRCRSPSVGALHWEASGCADRRHLPWASDTCTDETRRRAPWASRQGESDRKIRSRRSVSASTSRAETCTFRTRIIKLSQHEISGSFTVKYSEKPIDRQNKAIRRIQCSHILFSVPH